MPDLSCSAKMAKTLLFVCNLFVTLAGVVLLGCGIWFLSDPRSVTLLGVTADTSLLPLIRAAGGVIIFVGLMLALIGFLGCWGAARQKTGCLSCFAAFLILLILLQIAATILAGVFHTQLTDSLGTSMNESLSLYYGRPDHRAVTEGWDFMQYEMTCCGVDNYTDWSTNDGWKTNTTVNDQVPATCCQLNSSSSWIKPVALDQIRCNEEAKTGSEPSTQLHRAGCVTKFENWFRHYWGILIGIVIGVIIIQLAGIILSCCLVSHIKRGYEYV